MIIKETNKQTVMVTAKIPYSKNFLKELFAGRENMPSKLFIICLKCFDDLTDKDHLLDPREFEIVRSYCMVYYSEEDEVTDVAFMERFFKPLSNEIVYGSKEIRIPFVVNVKAIKRFLYKEIPLPSGEFYEDIVNAMKIAKKQAKDYVTVGDVVNAYKGKDKDFKESIQFYFEENDEDVKSCRLEDVTKRLYSKAFDLLEFLYSTSSPEVVLHCLYNPHSKELWVNNEAMENEVPVATLKKLLPYREFKDIPVDYVNEEEGMDVHFPYLRIGYYLYGATLDTIQDQYLNTMMILSKDLKNRMV